MTATGLFQIAAERLQASASDLQVPLLTRLVGVLGIATMIAIAMALSTDRRKINWRLVGIGLALQAVFGVIVLKTAVGRLLFDATNTVFLRLLDFTEEGARFIFGNLVRQNVPVGAPAGTPPDMSPIPAPETWAATGAYFAFSVLPTIIFFSSLMSVLYYVGFMQWVVRWIAWVMHRTMRTSGAETLSVAADIFVGQTEAPLVIKPFVKTMTMSELNTIMVAGFATVAGGVMAAYVGMLSPYFPDIAGHMLTASVMNAPAAILISKIMVPEVGEPLTRGALKFEVERTEANIIEAAASGAGQGLQLALNVAAMLLAFIALVALANAGVAALGGLFGMPNLSLEMIFGWVLRPLAWVIGIPWSEAGTVGSLIGVKTVLNEFVAYLRLAGVLEGSSPLSPRSGIIATYALLGFANFSSIAIQIGGTGGLAPERRGDLARLGLKAMIGGNLCTFMTASLAGLLL